MRNILNLEIGQKVFVTNFSELAYNEAGVKEVITKPFAKAAFVVGITCRCTGIYQKGGYGISLDGYDYEPPTFRPLKRILFYECRETIHSKPILVHPDHIEV